MTPFEIGMIALGLMGLLVLLGMHVPVALIACSFADEKAHQDEHGDYAEKI